MSDNDLNEVERFTKKINRQIKNHEQHLRNKKELDEIEKFIMTKTNKKNNTKQIIDISTPFEQLNKKIIKDDETINDVIIDDIITDDSIIDDVIIDDVIIDDVIIDDAIIDDVIIDDVIIDDAIIDVVITDDAIIDENNVEVEKKENEMGQVIDILMRELDSKGILNQCESVECKLLNLLNDNMKKNNVNKWVEWILT